MTTDPGHHPGPQDRARSRPLRPRRGLVIAAVALAWLVGGAISVAAALLAIAVVGRSSARPRRASAWRRRDGHQPRAAPGDEYGIRLNLVGVTPAGGLVDLRFTITDVGQGEEALHRAPASCRRSSPSATGTVLQAPHGGHHGHVTPVSGASYFVLIGNAGGVVQRGVPVSVAHQRRPRRAHRGRDAERRHDPPRHRRPRLAVALLAALVSRRGPPGPSPARGRRHRAVAAGGRHAEVAGEPRRESPARARRGCAR